MPNSLLRWRHPVYAAPRALRPWLTERGSLTARLIGHHPCFRVKVLKQGMALPHHDELQPLTLPRRAQALGREVLLLSGETALVYAHSVVPRSALRSGFRMLNRQGARSLGATLFANPRIWRGTLMFAKIPAPSLVVPRQRGSRQLAAPSVGTPFLLPAGPGTLAGH